MFITLERRGFDAIALQTVVPNEPIGIAAITATELLYGVQRADSPTRRAKREAYVEEALRLAPIVPFDLLAARRHAQI